MSDEPRCSRCNRKLKDLESLRTGMGKTCYRKHQDYVEQFYISLFDEPERKPKKKPA